MSFDPQADQSISPFCHELVYILPCPHLVKLIARAHAFRWFQVQIPGNLDINHPSVFVFLSPCGEIFGPYSCALPSSVCCSQSYILYSTLHRSMKRL